MEGAASITVSRARISLESDGLAVGTSALSCPMTESRRFAAVLDVPIANGLNSGLSTFTPPSRLGSKSTRPVESDEMILRSAAKICRSAFYRIVCMADRGVKGLKRCWQCLTRRRNVFMKMTVQNLKCTGVG